MDQKTLYDRIAGCLMAGALGDALGYTVEFTRWSGIQDRFGPGGIRALVPDGGRARISDDTQMTLFTNEGMVLGAMRAERGDPAPVETYVYHAYLCWLQTQDGFAEAQPSMLAGESRLLPEPGMCAWRAPGNTCLAALRSGTMGTLSKPINASKGCGGVMRTAPLGFTARWGRPLETGAAAAAITHGHPGGWAPGGMLSDLVYRLIYGEARPLEAVVTASLEAVCKAWRGNAIEEFADMVVAAVRLSHSDVPDVDAIHSLGGGWVGDEALAIAIYSCLKHPDDVIAALISAVNHSGDSDSTGAIAGNILGARLGLSAVPSDWIDQLELTDVILEQARLAVEAAADSARSR